MGYFAWQVRFEENVTRFFPDTKNNQNITKVFDNLKIKDKIIILISPADSIVTPD
jgi:predicted RND superfamily exporter protein